MSLLQRLKQIYIKATAQSNPFETPVEKQVAFLSRFPEPRDDVDRSYFQYRCQFFLLKGAMPLLLNMVSLVALPMYSLRYRFATVPNTAPAEAVFLYSGADSILPASLSSRFQITQDNHFQEHAYLTASDWEYLRKLRRRYPFSFYFRFKCMVKLAMYAYVFARYLPQAIICSEEYSFTSSLLTDYCAKRQVEHINVMHGDKFYDITDSFFHFHHCYVWNAYYQNLLLDLRAEPSQFMIEIPQCYCFSHRFTEYDPIDYTYYLQDQSTEQILKILEFLSTLKDCGKIVAVRLHPLYNDHSRFLLKDSHGLLIEDPHEIPIEDSILRTKCVISQYSTVLLQAAMNGKAYRIDDISSPEIYIKLKDFRSIFLEGTPPLFSTLLNDISQQHTLSS